MDKIFKELNLAITVCDENGKILEMNDASEKVNLKPGMPPIIGKNVLDCHPEPAKSKLAGMLKEPQTNVYTIEKNGVKKLIYQTPLVRERRLQGFDRTLDGHPERDAALRAPTESLNPKPEARKHQANKADDQSPNRKSEHLNPPA